MSENVLSLETKEKELTRECHWCGGIICTKCGLRLECDEDLQ